MVGPEVAAATAEAAVTVLCDESSCPREIFNVDGHFLTIGSQPYELERELDQDDVEMKERLHQSVASVTIMLFYLCFLVREFLEEKGNGRVLVVDDGASMRCAILRGNTVVQAQNNGWAGILVNGCVRDVDEINCSDIGVRALASHPMKANKKGIGEKHVPVTFAGTRICDRE
ncbi:hypothetical protein ACFE04_028339 [Oxalis oulophora]